MTSPDLHPPAEIRAAALAVANALTQYETYALVGGSACVVLGSTRATLDIDFVVPQGETSNARQLLRASPDFEVEARTNHTTYKARRPVQIEILTPPLLFKEPFDQNTEVILVEGIKVLKPALLLNAKCGSITCRSTEDKRKTDLYDINFVLNFCAQSPEYLPRAGEVLRATKQLVEVLVQLYGGEDVWIRAGYDMQTGRSHLMPCMIFKG
ncbi:similar to An03g02230 [Aspergillus niger]|uniref:Similar to An03g02230 n=1 Tax=Aspergillus niger TaxID=5061 RepID=A0A117E3Y6_ASPNG|nr:similar to An03g02230 [Aspergillus niger]